MGFVSIFRYFEIRTFYPYTLLRTGLKYPKFKNLTLHLTAMDWATLWLRSSKYLESFKIHFLSCDHFYELKL